MQTNLPQQPQSTQYIDHVVAELTKNAGHTPDPVRVGTPADLAWLFYHLSDPLLVENLRRALRNWFVAFIPEGEPNNTPYPQQGHLDAYETLDDLLSGIARMANEFEPHTPTEE